MISEDYKKQIFKAYTSSDEYGEILRLQKFLSEKPGDFYKRLSQQITNYVTLVEKIISKQAAALVHASISAESYRMLYEHINGSEYIKREMDEAIKNSIIDELDLDDSLKERLRTEGLAEPGQTPTGQEPTGSI